MSRKTVHLVLILLVLATAAQAAMPNPFRRRSAGGRSFPDSGDVPNLEPIGKVVTYRGETFREFYGAASNRYFQYGLENMMVGEYTYGGKDRRISIELATMENPTAAAGLFHHHRGNVVAGGGTPVPVGAEGVLDSNRDGRNLYFYRANIFVKVVYSGEKPVPDLLPVAKFVDEEIPRGRDAKPEGLTYIEIEGVDVSTVALTPGFTFNISFLPPAVWASAPGGGSVASDMFLITRQNAKDAAELYKDYFSYLKLNAEYVEEYRRGKQRFTKAVDPNQGRVLFTSYRNVFIIAARPDGYEKGEVLIDRVMAKIDAAAPEDRRRR